MEASNSNRIIRQIERKRKNIITHYELWSILRDPELSGKAKFFDPGGAEVSLEE